MSVPSLFAIVEPGLYRSNAITEQHFPFISKLHLKTVIYLSPDIPSRSLSNFYESQHINIHLALDVWSVTENNYKQVSDELIKEALQLMLNNDNYPILVTCTTGVRVTGVVVGCLRKLQRWSFFSIIEEHRNIAWKIKSRVISEILIELFDTDLVNIPENVPEWFKIQSKFLEEEDKEYAEMKKNEKNSTISSVTPISLPAYKKYYYDLTCPMTSTP